MRTNAFWRLPPSRPSSSGRAYYMDASLSKVKVLYHSLAFDSKFCVVHSAAETDVQGVLQPTRACHSRRSVRLRSQSPTVGRSSDQRFPESRAGDCQPVPGHASTVHRSRGAWRLSAICGRSGEVVLS